MLCLVCCLLHSFSNLSLICIEMIEMSNNFILQHRIDILTELNLMTYDFMGSWNPTTGANAPLYDMDGHPEFSVHGCVENWKAGGGRPDQINLGLPFYGRSFAGAGITVTVTADVTTVPAALVAVTV